MLLSLPIRSAEIVYLAVFSEMAPAGILGGIHTDVISSSLAWNEKNAIRNASHISYKMLLRTVEGSLRCQTISFLKYCMYNMVKFTMGALFWGYYSYSHYGLGITEYMEFQFRKERSLIWKRNTHGRGDCELLSAAA